MPQPDRREIDPLFTDETGETVREIVADLNNFTGCIIQAGAAVGSFAVVGFGTLLAEVALQIPSENYRCLAPAAIATLSSVLATYGAHHWVKSHT